MEKFSAQQDSLTLVEGTPSEISAALKQLGASPATIAKASVSFLVKLPGAQVSRVEGGFQVGGSRLPELEPVATAVEGTRGKFAELLARSHRVVANDEKFALAA
jgi:uncharacterized protein YqgV (UPF0045/DUF77 family)